MCTCVFIFASCLGVCVSVCVFTAFACVCDSARLCTRAFVHICVCRTPLWWFSCCRAAGWCTPQSRLPVSCAARGNFWSQPSLWSCSSTKTWMCSTHTRLSCICRPGATRTQVCWERIYLLWVLFLKSLSWHILCFNLRKNTVSVIKKLFVLYFLSFITDRNVRMFILDNVRMVQELKLMGSIKILFLSCSVFILLKFALKF